MQRSKIALKEFWTFRNESRKKFTHGLHQYPARMHPEIAKNIITNYAENKRTLIIDPFVGSGGVLIEAMLKDKKLTPIELAKETNIPLSHISNTLAELLEKDMVVCLTPELKKGRLYELTKEGHNILKNLE